MAEAMRKCGATHATRKITHKTGEIEEYSLILEPKGFVNTYLPESEPEATEQAQDQIERKKAIYFDLFGRKLEDSELKYYPDL